jgi:DNA-binding LytR/AlgR family response regulator
VIDALTQSPTIGSSAYKEHFLGNARNTWVPVKVKDVAYFMRDELIFMVTLDQERYILDYESLEEVELLLDPTRFYRANRHSIVNIDAVQSVKGLANLKLNLKLKAPNHQVEFDISRTKAPSFKKWLEK